MTARRTALTGLFTAVLLAAALWVPAGPAYAASCAGVPAHGTSPIVDAARVIDDAAERPLAGVLEAHRRASGAAIVVLTVPSLSGRTVEDFAHEVFQCWGVGARERNDGVLVVLAMRDRKLRIEVGTGLRDRLTDTEAAEVIEAMVPSLRSGDVIGAVATGASLVVAEVSVPPLAEPQDAVPGRDAFPNPVPSAFPGESPVDFPSPPNLFPLIVAGAALAGGTAFLRGLLRTGGSRVGGASTWGNVPFLTGRPTGARLPGFDAPPEPLADRGRSSGWLSSFGGGSSSGGFSGGWSGSSSSDSGSSYGGGSSGGGASGSW